MPDFQLVKKVFFGGENPKDCPLPSGRGKFG